MRHLRYTAMTPMITAMARRAFLPLLAPALLLGSVPVHAWHNEGHEAITRLAVAISATQLPEFFAQRQGTIVEWTQKLSVAFAEYRQWPEDGAIPDKIAVYAGILAHYTGDLAQPLHVTIHHDGKVAKPGDASPKSGIHIKVDALVGRVGIPSAGTPCAPPSAGAGAWDIVLAALQESHGQVERVYALADRMPDAGTPVLDPDVQAFARERAEAGALLPPSLGGVRADGKDLVATLRQMGCAVVTTAAEMSSLQHTPAWGLFADDDMAYDWDRATFAPEQPSLAEMTRKAIELLAQKPNGFFLFVEGSKVDWASHANDPAGVVSDLLAFDRAVEVAHDYARADGRTLLLVFPDHDCGGLSLGNASTNRSYSRLNPEALTAPLAKVRLTAAGVQQQLAAGEATPGRVRDILRHAWGIDDTTEAEVAHIAAADPLARVPALVAVLNQRCPLGWTTTGHTGDDVPLFAYGPGAPRGRLDNTWLAIIAARAMGCDLEQANHRLYVPAETLFPNLPLTLDLSDPATPALCVTRGNRELRFLINTNLMVDGTETIPLEGLVVMAPVRYAEVRRDHRIYVLGSPGLAGAAQRADGQFHDVSSSVIRIGHGPGGETVVFESDPKYPGLEQRLMEAFSARSSQSGTRPRVFLPRQAARHLFPELHSANPGGFP